VRNRTVTLLLLLLCGTLATRASVAVFLEEPYGTFGGMNPTGHAAIYLSRVCTASPFSLRRCNQGEQGVVISRYDRVAGFDWIAIPLLPYLYAVDRPDQVPQSVAAEAVAALRDTYRRRKLEEVAPDAEDGSTPRGDWTQLVGEAFDRTIYAFEMQTTQQQDDAFIQAFNSSVNRRHFNILFHNCADFVRQAVDFYYPRAIHRSLIVDAGIMTPKQAAKSLVSYSKHHPDLQFSIFVIPQVPGRVPRSKAVRGVLESLVKSKRYAVPLVSVAVLYPVFGGALAVDWLEGGSHFDPRKIAKTASSPTTPGLIGVELLSNRVVTDAAAVTEAKNGTN
jgi:hypothetical protein